jgi:hypothetical protein
VVVLVQENKTVDFLFRSLAAWGADVEVSPTPLAAAPDHDQPHDRNAWVHYAMGDYPAVHAQVDDEALVPLYSWLAKTFTFCDHHVGLGTNSTPGHLLAVCGQTPTLKNPPFGAGGPQWDLPTILVHAERAGVEWAAFTDQDQYPTKLCTELRTRDRRSRIHVVKPGAPDPFLAMAAAGTLPPLVYCWSPAGYDEHPPFRGSDPQYLARGHEFVWRRIDAVVQAGLWEETTFVLTYDDWGGYADHVVTPSVETVVDPLHPDGFPVLAGSRLPLVMFGGRVVQGIETGWHSHASIPRTIIDLFGLPPLGVPRVDTAPSLAGRVTSPTVRPVPPAPGSTIVQPAPPSVRPAVPPTGPWPGPLDQPMPPVILNGGRTIPAPSDALVRATPPKPSSN